VYRLVTDPSAAEEAALDAVEAGDLPLLSRILIAAPTLHDRPASWNLAAAVLLLAQDQPDQARDLATQVAENANTLQRRAHAIRLRALRTHQPELPGLDEIITLIDPEAAAS
jgi:hypothetical protein